MWIGKNKMLKFFLILGSVLFCEMNIYNITMMGINVAKVSININETMDNSQSKIKKIVYTSSTKSLFEVFYPVSNYHETIIEGNNILKYKKLINQSDYKESSTTYRKNDTTFYDSGNFICKDCHNIFSLLDFVQNNPYEVINKEFIIDKDGESFKAKLSLKSIVENIITIQLNFDLLNNQVYKNRKNDIFLWGLFLPNCDRFISIDLNTNQIVKCQFKNKLINLEADLFK